MKNSVKAHLVCLLQTLPMYLPLQAQLRHNQTGKWSAAPSEPAVLSSMASIDSNLESLYQELDAAEEALRLQGASAPVSLDSPTEESSEDQIRESWFAVLDTLDVKAPEGWRRQRETLKDSVVAAIEALQWVSPSQVVVPTKLIQRAQQAINWHLEPNSSDEHEATMVELSKIGWPDGPILVESEPVRLKDRLDALPDAAAIELATGYRLPSSAVVAIQKLMTDYAERSVRVDPSAPSVMPVPVCWLKHGPYEGDEPLSVVFTDPKDPDGFSALGYIVEPALTGVKPTETSDGVESDQEAYLTSEILRLHEENAELLKQLETYESRSLAAARQEAVVPSWIVNDLGELGVKVADRFFFLYKGYSLEYGGSLESQRLGFSCHDDGKAMHYRIVGKREFGETCWPLHWVTRGFSDKRYTQELTYREGLSDGKPEDAEWKPLPCADLTPSQAGKMIEQGTAKLEREPTAPTSGRYVKVDASVWKLIRNALENDVKQQGFLIRQEMIDELDKNTFPDLPQDLFGNAITNAQVLDWISRQGSDFSCQLLVDCEDDGKLIVHGCTDKVYGIGVTLQEACLNAMKKERGES